MKAYVVRITYYNGHCEYIYSGRNYVVNGCSYVPFTERIGEARKYKTKYAAEKACLRKGENMFGHIEIIEVENEEGAKE